MYKILEGYLEVFRPISKEEYKQWQKSRGLFAPTAEDIYSDHLNQDYLRTLLCDVVMEVKYDEETYIAEFKKGFTWDNASVPGAFKSIVDDNHPDIIYPAMFHDGAHITQLFGTDKAANKMTNDVFKKMIDSTGNKSLGFFAWLGTALGSWGTYKDLSKYETVMQKYCTITPVI